ncbi:ABC-type transport auxiliary lipoprotein family protein [Sulfurimonas sp.]|nr:ABC-type transport auxiliary lipoprotein family protein [Sulfurimonas sp.]
MKTLFILVTLILLSGCTVKKPSIVEYKINSQNIVPISSQNGCKSKSLKVAQAFSSSVLMSTKMDYSLPNSRVFSYSQSQWRESPNHFITQEILEDIRSTKLFKYVQVSKSRTSSDLILESNIEEFMQYYDKDNKNSYSSIVISLSLVDSATASVISSKTFDAKFDAISQDAEGGVNALNESLGSVIEQSTIWLNEVCK